MLAANDVASLILSRHGQWLDAMSLQKLLYYTQAWHLALTDARLFPEPIQAWKDGPVVADVWRDRKDRASRRPAVQNVSSIPVDDFTVDLIDLVLASYGSMTGEELSALTHVEAPWLEARGGLPEDASCREVVDPASMARFYRTHRLLGGRTAADLAAGGIHVRSHHDAEPLDVDAFLDSLSSEYRDAGPNDWGSANVDPGHGYDTEGLAEHSTRTYSGS